MKKVNILSSQRGDTIVEVLIATAVIGMALTIAYVTSSNALRTGRQAQERIEALKFGESQLEKLRNLDSKGIDTKIDPSLFCVDDDTIKNLPFNSLPTLEDDDFLQYKNTVGIPDDQYDCTYSFFNTATDYSPPDGTYTISVRWERLGGGRDELKLYYRMEGS